MQWLFINSHKNISHTNLALIQMVRHETYPQTKGLFILSEQTCVLGKLSLLYIQVGGKAK